MIHIRSLIMSIFSRNAKNFSRISKMPIEILWPHKNINHIFEYNKNLSSQKKGYNYEYDVEWSCSRFEKSKNENISLNNSKKVLDKNKVDKIITNSDFNILGLDWPSSRFK
jgi:hypothetical protein